MQSDCVAPRLLAVCLIRCVQSSPCCLQPSQDVQHGLLECPVLWAFITLPRCPQPERCGLRGNEWDCMGEADATTWGSLKRSPILADLENSDFDLKTNFYSESLFSVLFQASAEKVEIFFLEISD